MRRTNKVAGLVLAIVGGACAAVPPGVAWAQDTLSPGYGPDTLTFETWCHEIQGYQTARCAQKNPADLVAYKSSLDNMQVIESQHRTKERKDREFWERFDDTRSNTQPSRDVGELP